MTRIEIRRREIGLDREIFEAEREALGRSGHYTEAEFNKWRVEQESLGRKRRRSTFIVALKFAAGLAALVGVLALLPVPNRGYLVLSGALFLMALGCAYLVKVSYDDLQPEQRRLVGALLLIALAGACSVISLFGALHYFSRIIPD